MLQAKQWLQRSVLLFIACTHSLPCSPSFLGLVGVWRHGAGELLYDVLLRPVRSESRLARANRSQDGWHPDPAAADDDDGGPTSSHTASGGDDAAASDGDAAALMQRLQVRSPERAGECRDPSTINPLGPLLPSLSLPSAVCADQ